MNVAIVIATRNRPRRVIELLESLQRPDFLHRISGLKIKPLLNSKLFEVSMTLEALALEKADATNAMPAVSVSRLAFPSVADYEAIICGRNIFRPPHCISIEFRLVITPNFPHLAHQPNFP